tara:strand:- start:246 stop:629 length:384 start_codon:yes stop_codon:yes gene_type:complete
MPHFKQAYKYEEIQEYFNDYLKDNLDYLKENDPITWHDDLHHYAFNENYYIIGTYKAKQWLGDQAFDIINIIKIYEQDNFGEVTTDFSDPERVVNMYVYIVGEKIVQDYLNKQFEKTMEDWKTSCLS